MAWRKRGRLLPKLKNLQEARIVCYSDATHASLPCGNSQGAHIVFLCDPDMNKAVPLTWESKKLSRVTKSPLASETLALGEGADSGFLLMALLKDILPSTKISTITCFTDNHSLVETVSSTNSIKDKRLI